MFKVPEADTVYCDVDDTLILTESACSPELFESEGIHITRPFGKGTITEMFVPHQVHIALLKEFKNKGKSIVVWSQGGSDWAEIVVKALQLEDFVDIVVGKPTWWIDDVSTDYFMPISYRIFKPYDGRSNTSD